MTPYIKTERQKKESNAANTAATAEEVYNDDIYVGYRFFDTFGKKVAYEFGYGESYTDFDIKVKTVKADAENVSVVAEVKNTGKVTGKEVVEVYFSATGRQSGQTVSGTGSIPES